ncbi:hypothetical protein AeMF1_005636 [Aphanomyces euteiches]|nr:hypothetical protein AeMF1_005636 [Aphanomyces euteiches]KAH9183999.1 hypothetical protein AeNC1_014028 [Aphanomyces euteiches]
MPKLNEAIRLAEASNWPRLLDLITATPALAKECDDYGMLPLHWASTDNNAPLVLLERLVEAYPEGVQIANKAQLLPLHIAIRARVSLPVLHLLIRAYPESILMETPSGSTPVALAEQSHVASDALTFLRNAMERQTPFENASWNNQKTVILSPTASSRPHSWHTLSRQASAPAVLTPAAAPLELSYEPSEGNSSDDNNKMATPKRWMLMDECFICHVPFNMFKHRHHCRNCGMSICSSHSAVKKMSLVGFSTPQRVCVSCVGDLESPTAQPQRDPISPIFRRREAKLFSSLVSPTSFEKKDVQELQRRVAALAKQVDHLVESNMGLHQQLLEQEEIKAETMLLITQVMTRVSVLELQNEQRCDDFDL